MTKPAPPSPASQTRENLRMDDVVEYLAHLANQARAEFAQEWQDAEETGERPDLEPITVGMRVEFAESLIDEITALRARFEAVERERRNGAHLMEVVKSLGWPDDGEGAFNFITRRTREVAIDDCAERAEAALATARRDALEEAVEAAWEADSLELSVHGVTIIIDRIRALAAQEKPTQ